MIEATATLKIGVTNQVATRTADPINNHGVEGLWLDRWVDRWVDLWAVENSGRIMAEEGLLASLEVTKVYLLKASYQGCRSLLQECHLSTRTTQWQLCSRCRQWASQFRVLGPFHHRHRDEGHQDRKRGGAETTT